MNKECNSNKVKVLNEITKRSIIEAFLLLLQNQPYEKISISDIVKKAGVARVSYYRNFDSKESIITAYLNSIFKMDEEVDNQYLTKQGLINKLRKQYQIYYENRKFLKLLERNNLLHLLYEHIYNRSISTIDKMEFYQNELQIPYFSGSAYGILLYWIKTDFTLSIDEVVKRFADMSYAYYQEKMKMRLKSHSMVI